LRVRGEAQPRAVEETLSTFVGPRDLIGLYAPGEYEMLLTDSSASPEQVEQVVSGIRLGLSRLGAAIDVGAARYGRDGHTAEALIARAEEGSSSRPSKPGEIIVVSAAMRALFKLVDRVAASGVNVLVCGEPGSGKQVVAEAIHRRSRRAAGPFVQLNCATLEAEALSGLASRVAGGTAFADDVGELPPRMQVALLRALSDPGWSGRVISATHRDLTQAAAHGLFHPDLLKLLEGISLTVPPLRARRDEIPLMAARFADPVPFTAEALALLGAYDWPGNVRELQNVVERAVRLAGAGPIDRAHLPVDKLSAAMILTPSIVHVLPISPSAERFDSGLERFDTLEPMGGSVPIDADGDAPRDGDED
jgi:DNA-binding NtrC family response regulator